MSFGAAMCGALCSVRGGCGRKQTHPFEKKSVFLYQGPKNLYAIREKRGTKTGTEGVKTCTRRDKSCTRRALFGGKYGKSGEK